YRKKEVVLSAYLGAWWRYFCISSGLNETPDPVVVQFILHSACFSVTMISIEILTVPEIL
ncbi:MAG: hypothetical protein KAQ71_05405, partial [Desulfobulbaceae bacterium]|nr:hypothetical protein [Desulfobulbaceae bacterium]